jgi:N12 class adenine-specific DNA methylase
VVTSHFTRDKQNAATREFLSERADFVGAIRLPSDAFKREGTSVVTDIVFLRKRAPGEPAHHADPDWFHVAPLDIDGADIAINKYFHNHPEQVLRSWSRNDTLYGEGLSVTANGDLAEQLCNAIQGLPEYAPLQVSALAPSAPAFTPPPPERYISEGSFFIGGDRTIRLVLDGLAVPVVYGGTQLSANGTLTGRRLAALIRLRDHARRVLQSQNEDWPEEARTEARRELNRAYNLFAFTYGPINKTTFSETKDASVIRRMPNLVKFREDPDAMLVMALEDYDEITSKATKAPILLRDVVGKAPPVTRVTSAEEGLLVSLNRKEDLTRERSKHLTAKIASGGWDGIIVTHSSFERIGMSRDCQEKFLTKQIAEYDELLREHAGAKGASRNLIKTIEKQKAARVERLKDLLAESKKDDGLVFDELGVDHLFIDEAQYYKNLETPTKMERVAGIQTGGSERAFDVYLKARYLHEQHAGHGVIFATGTPISNTMVEMYTMQRFLDPEGLRQRGLEHFDAWVATFGEVIDTMEISPDGAALRPRSRFARFTNPPELQQMLRAFADVQTADMLDLPPARSGRRQAHHRRLPDVRRAARSPAGARPAL